MQNLDAIVALFKDSKELKPSQVEVFNFDTSRQNAIGSLLIDLVQENPKTRFIVYSIRFGNGLPVNMDRVRVPGLARLPYFFQIILFPTMLKATRAFRVKDALPRLSCDPIVRADGYWVHFCHSKYLVTYVDYRTPRYLTGAIRKLKHQLKAKIERKLLPRAGVIIVPTPRLARELYQEKLVVGTPPPLIRPNHAAASRGWPVAQQDLDRKHLGLVAGGDFVRKGVFDAIDAMSGTRQLRLTVAGGSSREINVARKLAVDRGLTGRVKFLGLVANPGEALADCATIVLPSRYEVASLALKEVLATGRTIIASDAGDALEMRATDERLIVYRTQEELQTLLASLDGEV